MQITPGNSPLTLAMLKTLGGQTAGSGTSVAAGLASSQTSKALASDLGGGAPARNEPAGPPEPGRFIPRGTFVDLKA